MLKYAYDWYRIADPTADTTRVENLKKSLTAFSKKFGSSRDSITTCVNIVIGGTIEQPANIVEDLVAAIAQHQPDFPTDPARNAQAVRMALSVLLGETIVNGKYPTKEAASVAFTSGTFLRTTSQEVQMKDVFAILRKAANDILNQTAKDDREISALDVDKVTGSDPESAEAIRDCFSTLETGLNIAREEVNLLWWLVSGYSESAEAFFVDMPISDALLCCAVELSNLSMVAPMKSVRAILQKQVVNGRKSEQKKPMSLSKLTKEWKQDCINSLRPADAALALIVRNRPIIFPLSWVCARISESGLKDGWQTEFESRTGILASEERSPEVWATQIFNERMAIRTLLETLDQ